MGGGGGHKDTYCKDFTQAVREGSQKPLFHLNQERISRTRAG